MQEACSVPCFGSQTPAFAPGSSKEKKKKKTNPVWADMMKHSLLCGKEAKVIYTSILHAEIKENGTEMPV